MAAAILEEERLNEQSLNEKQQEKSHNRVHHFIITVDINADKARQFIDSLSPFDAMKKAALSAIPQGICIKLEASNKLLSEFVFAGIQCHSEVKKVQVAVSA